MGVETNISHSMIYSWSCKLKIRSQELPMEVYFNSTFDWLFAKLGSFMRQFINPGVLWYGSGF